MKMRPEQFTMWLRGVLEAVGEGNPVPSDVSQRVYDQLTEVVAGQVADRIEESWDTGLTGLGKGSKIPAYYGFQGSHSPQIPETVTISTHT